MPIAAEIKSRCQRRCDSIQKRIDAAKRVRDNALMQDRELELFAACDLMQRLVKQAEALEGSEFVSDDGACVSSSSGPPETTGHR